MQPYQEEYIANLRDIALLVLQKKPAGHSFEEYKEELIEDRRRLKERVSRNISLLREHLFPLLDNLLDAKEEEIAELEEFAGRLLNGREELDGGLFCQIHQALLSRARLSKDQNSIIRHLYWLGIGRNNMYGKMVGMELEHTEKYISKMRLCFAEAAAYLKYYDEIEDSETRGYILRSRANIALGQFKSPSAKIRLTRQTLEILNDKGYREKAPDLPWDRYVYMTHQQMASSISYNRDNDMTAGDVAAIMESAHIVYQKRIRESMDRNETPPIKSAFSCCATEYYCGLNSLEGLLSRMERLMDTADCSDFSAESMYGVISLPAFYCQYMREYPEQLMGRQEYLDELYRRVLAYVDEFPEGKANEQLFYFLRQLSSTFVETGHGVTYGEFQQKLLMRFAPEIYVHSQVVGKAASVLCGMIIDEEPAFFDDIRHIREIQDRVEKRRETEEFAMGCGAFHDIGKINFLSLYSQTARQWFEEEYEMAHLHTVVGEMRLSSCISTKRYAAVALGHHSWYDGTHEHPAEYKRLECPYRQMVDVIALIDGIDSMMNMAWLYGKEEKTYEEAVREAVALEGRRFSPLLTARLRDSRVSEEIGCVFEKGRQEAYRNLYGVAAHAAQTVKKADTI